MDDLAAIRQAVYLQKRGYFTEALCQLERVKAKLPVDSPLHVEVDEALCELELDREYWLSETQSSESRKAMTRARFLKKNAMILISVLPLCIVVPAVWVGIGAESRQIGNAVQIETALEAPEPTPQADTLAVNPIELHPSTRIVEEHSGIPAEPASPALPRIEGGAQPDTKPAAAAETSPKPEPKKAEEPKPNPKPKPKVKETLMLYSWGLSQEDFSSKSVPGSYLEEQEAIRFDSSSSLSSEYEVVLTKAFNQFHTVVQLDQPSQSDNATVNIYLDDKLVKTVVLTQQSSSEPVSLVANKFTKIVIQAKVETDNGTDLLVKEPKLIFQE